MKFVMCCEVCSGKGKMRENIVNDNKQQRVCCESTGGYSTVQPMRVVNTCVCSSVRREGWEACVFGYTKEGGQTGSCDESQITSLCDLWVQIDACGLNLRRS